MMIHEVSLGDCNNLTALAVDNGSQRATLFVGEAYEFCGSVFRSSVSFTFTGPYAFRKAEAIAAAFNQAQTNVPALPVAAE